MRKIIVGKTVKRGARLDEYIFSIFPALPRGALYKAFRKKDVKVGDKWVKPETYITPSDVICVYLPDEVLFGAPIEPAIARDTGSPPFSPGFSIVYEDSRVLIVNKPRGLSVHPDRGGRGVTLIELVGEYLRAAPSVPAPSVAAQNGAAFNPAMCHRLDRNTGGLVVVAKDREALNAINILMSDGSVVKGYRCIVAGRPEPPAAALRAYIVKDAAKGKATVFHTREEALASARVIMTEYKALESSESGDASKLDVTLRTGRTHQIRAHLASIGHPIIGDGKYCPNAVNKLYRRVPYQLLTAYRLKFPQMPGFKISGLEVEIADGLDFPVKR